MRVGSPRRLTSPCSRPYRLAVLPCPFPSPDLRRSLFGLVVLCGLLAGGATAEEFRECPACPQMVAIPAGKFLMGSPAHEPGRFDSEGPQHVVTVKAFALSKYKVTSEEFLTFLRATSYQPKPCNALLGLGWSQQGRGLAYPPSQNEPPRWPAEAASEGHWGASRIKICGPWNRSAAES